MNRSLVALCEHGRRVPRVCGDEPGMLRAHVRYRQRSPRMRG